jgi:hypothetical protein
LYSAHLRYAINAKPRPTGPQLKKINAFKYSLGLLKRAVRKSAAKGHRVLSVFGSKTKKIFSKKFLKILQKY